MRGCRLSVCKCITYTSRAVTFIYPKTVEGELHTVCFAFSKTNTEQLGRPERNCLWRHLSKYLNSIIVLFFLYKKCVFIRPIIAFCKGVLEISAIKLLINILLFFFIRAPLCVFSVHAYQPPPGFFMTFQRFFFFFFGTIPSRGTGTSFGFICM